MKPLWATATDGWVGGIVSGMGRQAVSQWVSQWLQCVVVCVDPQAYGAAPLGDGHGRAGGWQTEPTLHHNKTKQNNHLATRRV